MDAGIVFLKKWVEEYLYHKDIIAKKIKEIKEKEDGLIVTYIDKQILVMPVVELDTIEIEKLAPSMLIVTFNTEKNFNNLKTNWYKWVEIPNLTLIFINPLTHSETKWIVQPSVHNKIADKDSLQRGLIAMFETVDTFHEDSIAKL